MGGSWTFFSSGRFILSSMKPVTLVCGGDLILAGLALAEDDVDINEDDEDLSTYFEIDAAMYEGLDVDLSVLMDDRKGSARGKCVTKPKPKPAMFKKYTKYKNNKPKADCPCWYDLNKSNCACCQDEADVGPVMQCGWPMNKYCYKKGSKGCPGVCNNAYTLSGKGFPCQNDPMNLDCAWCTMTGFQCFPDKWNGPNSKAGSRCQKQTNQKYCKSVQGDCLHIPGACPSERCVKVKQINKYMKYYECQCPEGYEGNGIQCFDTQTGEQLVLSDQYVDLQLTLSQNISTFPFDGTNLPTGVELQNLITEMGNVAGSCSGACEATFQESIVEN